MHHVVDARLGHLMVGGIDLGPTKHLVFFVLAALLVIVIARLAHRELPEGRIPTGLGAVVETLVRLHPRRDRGEEHRPRRRRKFTPLLLQLLLLHPGGGAPGPAAVRRHLTGNIAVTWPWPRSRSWPSSGRGISKYGVVHHFAGIVPPGLPAWLLPIMIPVEILSMFTKPFALMIRLFANMLAGHMVITTLLLLIPLMAAISTAFGIVDDPGLAGPRRSSSWSSRSWWPSSRPTSSRCSPPSSSGCTRIPRTEP